jgi:hypothetical protein
MSVNSFMDITGASKKQAQQYLKRANNNVEVYYFLLQVLTHKVAIANWFDAGDSPELDEPEAPAVCLLTVP